MLNSRYSFPDLIRLCWSFLITKVFFRRARLIRQPTRIRGYSHISLGENFTTGQFCRLEAGSKDIKSSLICLKIGNNVQINDRCHIAAYRQIEIGDDVLIASDVFITDHDHGQVDPASLIISPRKRPIVFSAVIIESKVWIGEKVIILKGVRVGEGSIVAAGSVVTRDVPKYSVVAGIPSRVIKTFS